MTGKGGGSDRRGGGLGKSALIIGGIAAAAAAPALLKAGQKAARGIGGMTFTSGVPGGPRPEVDPAAARPA